MDDDINSAQQVCKFKHARFESVVGENSRWVVLELPSNVTEAEGSKAALGSTAEEAEAEGVAVQNRVVEVEVESVGK